MRNILVFVLFAAAAGLGYFWWKNRSATDSGSGGGATDPCTKDPNSTECLKSKEKESKKPPVDFCAIDPTSEDCKKSITLKEFCKNNPNHFDCDPCKLDPTSVGCLKKELDCKSCPEGYTYDGANCRFTGIALPPGAKAYYEGVQMRYKVSKGNKGTDSSDCVNGSSYIKSFFGGNYCQLDKQAPDGYEFFEYQGQFYVKPKCK